MRPLPTVLVGIYVVVPFAYYVRHLDSALTYVSPPVATVPEDVLGSGFFSTWIPFLIVWAAAHALTHSRSRPLLRALSIASFVVVSVVECAAALELESQVPAAAEKWGRAP